MKFMIESEDNKYDLDSVCHNVALARKNNVGLFSDSKCNKNDLDREFNDVHIDSEKKLNLIVTVNKNDFTKKIIIMIFTVKKKPNLTVNMIRKY